MMIIVDPDKTKNKVKVLPRYYDCLTTDLTVTFTNEDTRTDLTNTVSNVQINDGTLCFDINATFINNSTYKIKIVDNFLALVIFRGKAFSTNQSKQNYSING